MPRLPHVWPGQLIGSEVAPVTSRAAWHGLRSSDREEGKQMSELSTRNTKLVHYLNEAYGMEMRLETTLQAHISMTSNDRYRRRLKEHLLETRRHGRQVKQRIKRLGGSAQTFPTPGPDVVSDAAGALIGRAEKAIALAQGPLHAVRGTGEAERQLRNAKSEYSTEAEEIATYTAIEALADLLGDKDTKQLARTIRRDEERMLAFLEREIGNQTKALARAEIPAAERRTPSRKRPAARRASTASSRTRVRKGATSAKTSSKSSARARSASGSRRSVSRPPARAKAAVKRPASRRASASAKT
jgi:ferritin-like metal-binding protein YciE